MAAFILEGQVGRQLYHRYVIPAQPGAAAQSNYRMTHFNASLSNQLVSCSKGFFWATWAHSTPALAWFFTKREEENKP